MANFQQASTYLRSLGRSILPAGFRSEKYTEEDFNEGMMGALTDFVQNTYAGKAPGSYSVDYKALNDYFKEGNVVTGGGSKFSDVGALKTVLGQFNVRVNPDGSYTILDTYDFNQQDEFGNKMNRQATMGDVFNRLNVFNDYKGDSRLYGAARMLGGVMIPEGGEDAVPIEINIPALSQPVQPPVAMPVPKPPRPQVKSFADVSTLIQQAAQDSLARKS